MSGKYVLAIFLPMAFYCRGQSVNAHKRLPAQHVKTAQEYLFPINPNSQNYLAGTMGELRATHLHSGIDIGTNKQVGVPVRAAQDGYVSKISVNPKGFGNALYITHTNGQTTVYAHLQRFEKELADYIREEQYKVQSFRIQRRLPIERWAVHRGDTVGYSGNSGSSTGPHLHFDIRNADNEALNPLRFGFEEITDNTPPIALKIALQTMDINSRINNRFGRFVFSLKKEKDTYTLPEPIFAKGDIGIEILAYDRMNNSSFQCGINYIETWVEGKKVFSQSIEKINFATTRSVLTMINYPSFLQEKQFFTKLYVSDGNDLSEYYEGTIKRGVLSIEGEEKSVKIVLKDTYGNQSEISFFIQPGRLCQETPHKKPESTASFFTTHENILVVKAEAKPNDKDSITWVFYGNKPLLLLPTYRDGPQNVFLVDMREAIPDSMTIGEETLRFGLSDIIPSGSAHEYDNRHLNIQFMQNALYDTVFLHTQYHNEEKEIFSIGPASYPLKNSITITLKPSRQYTASASVYRIADKSYEYKGGDWKDNKISFSAKAFGDYTIMVDTIPPTATRVSTSGNNIRFKIKDDRSGIATYKANINGKWLLMQYDPKTSILKSDPLDRLKPLLKGVFTLEVTDYAGNKNIYSSTVP